MKNLADRIRKCAEVTGSAVLLSQKTAIPARTLDNYIAGSTEPKASKVLKIAEVAGVSAAWLLTGEGEMFGCDKNMIAEPAATYDVKPDSVSVPIYDVSASAGHGSLVDNESVTGYLQFMRPWIASKFGSEKNLAIIRVSGDSMEPTLSNGDTVMVNMAETTLEGDGIFALLADGSCYIKRLQKIPSNKVMVISDNKMFQPWEITLNDLDLQENYRIIGRVVWVGKVL